MRVLAGDIGGTKTRLAVFDVHGTRLETLTERSYPSGSYSGLEDIVQDFLGGTSVDCRQACFGIAGPVQRGRAQATNLPWIVEQQAIAALFGFERVALINDLEANAWGIGALRPQDFCPLNSGSPTAAGNACIISAGTGLGEAGLYWDGQRGRLLLEIDAFDTPFLYQTSLPRGIGSNDIGLDRGQLGAGRVVRFLKSGPRVLMVEDNLQYRASSDNDDERRAITESFARSVVWGFVDIDPAADSTVVDATQFFLRDAHGVAPWLQELGEGSYSVDDSRSAIYLANTRGFPDNTEVEALVTFTGEPAGPHLPTVAPDARAVSVHIRHSFIRLPDDAYEPLPYDPRSGVIGLRYNTGGFADYAQPVGAPLIRDYGRRHRLEKVAPEAEVSAA